jgi:hypothetical protein
MQPKRDIVTLGFWYVFVAQVNGYDNSGRGDTKRYKLGDRHV